MDAKTPDRDTQWYQKVFEIYSGVSQNPSIRLIYAELGEPTSGLEPLTCSLRVRNSGLQGMAAACYGLQNPHI
jgi:hypothetical protein